MNIAVLSGKGGTGKTTVSTNLALAMNRNYVDCDVEEPNGFLFLKPEVTARQVVTVGVPDIDKAKCTLCGACAKVCRFHALAKAGSDIVIFEKLCHDCSACKLVCKEDALSYRRRNIGIIEQGISRGIECSAGILNVGEPMAVPVIKELLSKLQNKDYLIDCPPGTSCNVVNTLKYANAALLVTEPSQFGLHDLKLAIELVKLYHIPFGVIINKDDGDENFIKEYCKENQIKLLGVIPYSQEAAKAYSIGCILYDKQPYTQIFDHISMVIKEAL
ncbi:ATP-binding protein [Mobilitalea sibirica]|uniref:ATP-binding protein n=1 Tax=Mobilitalea sibirica TaxID=1462919 RepID=A0A8J7KRL8_9FIRM|nr:ATP-binding protein [Mobilitalea sibirica]MBH1939426.1 ATP-binding protein [Mobilitalea sibirica]